VLTRAELPEVAAAASEPRRTTALRDLVVVANRLPVCAAAADHWRSSPGGLVSALEPAVRTSRTRWVGWTGVANKTSQPFVHGDVELFPLRLEESEVDEFYNGFSNSTLWPLYHDAIFIPQFHRSWWASYVTVNQRFADAAVRVAPRGATIWIHDYHLELVPAMIRRQRDAVRIGFFLHIPFPSEDLVLRIPWRNELTLGMLGADVVGFQTTAGAENFRNVVTRLLGLRAIGNIVEHDGRSVPSTLSRTRP
jgi:trehalose 6-phosphate synthase